MEELPAEPPASSLAAQSERAQGRQDLLCGGARSQEIYPARARRADRPDRAEQGRKRRQRPDEYRFEPLLAGNGAALRAQAGDEVLEARRGDLRVLEAQLPHGTLQKRRLLLPALE